MTEDFRQKVRRLTNIRALDFLERLGPSTLAQMEALLQIPRRVSLPKLLAELEEAGLVIRQQEPTHGNAKPYSITLEGQTFLEEARQTPAVPEGGERKDWTERERAPDLEMHQAIVDVLVGEPEFRGRPEMRIRNVASKILDAVQRVSDVGR